MGSKYQVNEIREKKSSIFRKNDEDNSDISDSLDKSLALKRLVNKRPSNVYAKPLRKKNKTHVYNPLVEVLNDKIDKPNINNKSKKNVKKGSEHLEENEFNPSEAFIRYSSLELGKTDSSDSDDFEDSLIQLDEIEEPTKDQKTSYENDYSKLDSILSEDDSCMYSETVPTSAEFSDIVALRAANGNIFSTLHEHNRSQIDIVKEKFKGSNFPQPITSKKSLLERVEKYQDIIPKLLKGKIEASSFYQLARAQRLKSSSETLLSKEKWLIDWNQYFGGYYGFKRQSFIASIILSRFKGNLNSASKKNSTVSYWSIIGFSTYVLANEMILRFVMEDFDCDIGRAEAIVNSSVEYGLTVTDSIALIDDLKLGELLKEESESFMKNINKDFKADKGNITLLKCTENKKKTPKKDILDNILDTQSSSDEE